LSGRKPVIPRIKRGERMTKENVDEKLRRISKAHLGLTRKHGRLAPGEVYPFGSRRYLVGSDRSLTEL
jgi:hypothetical protein